MTTEELLKSRVKVIAPYPNSPYKVGEILTEFFFDNGNSYFSVNKDEKTFPDRVINSRTINECPNIFRKMEWWEDRKIEDMPEYLKEECTGEVIKTEWRWNERLEIEGRNIESKEWYETDIATLDSLPATIEEYEQYLKTKQQ